MAENAQEQLLGYLLDALEDDERRQLQQELAHDPQLRQQLETLRTLLEPMEPSREPIDPPHGLARRACRYVAAQAAAGFEAGRRIRPVPARRFHAMRPDARFNGGPSRFGWLDVVAAAGIMVAASLLIFPAIHNSRVQAQRALCVENLHSIGLALGAYSDAFAGAYPSAPPGDRLGVGGGFAPVLCSMGYLEEPRQLVCPGSSMSQVAGFSVPTPGQILAMPEGEALDACLASIGGSYSMSRGYEENGRYHGLRNLGRSDFALVSDNPDPAFPDFRSHNHPGGRNVLFGGGNVRFMVVPVATVGNDHVYLNAAGRIAPGLNSHDSAIPPAGRVPIVFTSNR